MVGALAANLHEGSRSEYLAQYIFASFGTAICIPHHEDNGIDLYCTLTERIGQRAWPRAYFSVQVKSTMDAWTFGNEESIRWLIEHPLPLFLCVVDKSAARIRVYHTSPRFYVWSLPPLPSRLELVPTTDADGRCTQWEGGWTFSLSAPILDASIQDLMDDEFHRNASQIFRFWISVDLGNLEKIKAGVHSFKMPAGYSTNRLGWDGWVIQGINKAKNLDPALERLKESAAWLSSQLYRKGDISGAVRCALLLRHFFKNDFDDGTHDAQLHLAINKLVGKSETYLYIGVDELNAQIDQKLTILSADGQDQNRVG